MAPALYYSSSGFVIRMGKLKKKKKSDVEKKFLSSLSSFPRNRWSPESPVWKLGLTQKSPGEPQKTHPGIWLPWTHWEDLDKLTSQSLRGSPGEGEGMVLTWQGRCLRWSWLRRGSNKSWDFRHPLGGGWKGLLCLPTNSAKVPSVFLSKIKL